MNDVIDIDAVAAIGAIGQPVRRKEDQRLLTGKGRFTDDFNLPGQICAVMVRSPHPHARIMQVGATRAKRMPGVLGVFSGRDCQADGLGPIPHSPVPSTRYDLKLTGPDGGTIFFGPQPLLPADRVRHVGEAVAMVVAETLPQALDAAEAVEVEYDDLPRVTSPRVAILPGAPSVWDEERDNVLVDTMFGDSEATDRAFAEADHIVRHKEWAKPCGRNARSIRHQGSPYADRLWITGFRARTICHPLRPRLSRCCRRPTPSA
jgi:carbon-monoxide dehydrogenase large subunit